MLDLSTFLTVGGLSVILTMLVQFLKRYVPDAQRPLIPWIALGLGIVLAPIAGFALGLAASPQQFVGLALTGFVAGLSSIGVYQATLNNLGNATPTLHPPPPAPNPPLMDGHVDPPAVVPPSAPTTLSVVPTVTSTTYATPSWFTLEQPPDAQSPPPV